jgi:hypothetical protein
MTKNNEDLLEDNIRHSYMGVVWSHKIQEKQADIYATQYRYLEIVRIICSTLTSVGIISLLFKDQFTIKIIATVISFVSTFISLFFKSFDTQSSIANHKKSANDLLVIRDKFRVLLVKIRMKSNNTDILDEYESLLEKLGEIYKVAPNTTEKAVKKASKALKINKDNEFTDEEINITLPETLRRNN